MKERKKEGIGSLPGLAFSGSGVLRAAQCVEKPRSERCFVVCTEDSGRAGLRWVGMVLTWRAVASCNGWARLCSTRRRRCRRRRRRRRRAVLGALLKSSSRVVVSAGSRSTRQPDSLHAVQRANSIRRGHRRPTRRSANPVSAPIKLGRDEAGTEHCRAQTLCRAWTRGKTNKQTNQTVQTAQPCKCWVSGRSLSGGWPSVVVHRPLENHKTTHLSAAD